MPLITLIEKGLYAALDSPVIETLAQRAGDKAVSILKEHFTFTAYEIAKAYQDSYGYALAAITAGLSAPDNKLAFIQRITKSKLSREFSAQIDSHYLQPFATERGVQSDALPELRQQFIEQIKTLSKQPPIFQADNARFTEAELAAFINYKGTLAITDLVLEQLRQVAPLAETLEAFLRYDELLGNTVLFFFREIIRKDARVQTSLEALQREGLWADVRDIKTAQEEFITQIQQQLDEQKAAVKQAIDAGDFSKATQITQQLQGLQHSVDDVQQRLQAAQAAWQNRQQHLIDFSQRFDTWALMLTTKVEQVLAAMETLHGTVAKIDNCP
jgi:hypothetical protein